MTKVPMPLLMLLGLLTVTCRTAAAPRVQPVSAAPPKTASAPSKTDVRKLYEAGKYQDVVQSVPQAVQANRGDEAELEYVAAQSYQKLSQWDHVRSIYSQLAARGQNDAWKYIGESGQAMLAKNNKKAVETASKAVQIGPDNAYAHYQLGMAESTVPDFGKSAQAFEKAALIDPTFAYAHYYAAMSYYKLKRIDKMATHFEAFLKLAPDAPERPQVQSIMRTVRGG